MLIGFIGVLTSILGVALIVGLSRESNIDWPISFYQTQALPPGFAALLSLISTNLAGYTKKTTCAAMFLIAYGTGNIIGP